MKVYDVLTGFNYSQVHSVVAESMGEAEAAYRKEYPRTTILEIKLHSEYVIVTKTAPQPSNTGDIHIVEDGWGHRFVVPAPSHHSPTISSECDGRPR